MTTPGGDEDDAFAGFEDGDEEEGYPSLEEQQRGQADLRVTVLLSNSRNADQLSLGPFAFVHLTYLLVRDDADHELATYNPVTDRWTTPAGQRFTDLIVYAKP